MFKVRLPFCPPEGRSFQLDQEGHRGEVLGKPARLERHAHNHVLIAEGLEDEEAAKEFLARLKAGLRWFAIDRVLGVSFEESIAELKRVQGDRFNLFGVEFDEPVDGIVDGDLPAILPSDLSIKAITLGRPSLSVTHQPKTLIEAVNYGAARARSTDGEQSRRFTLAADLYSHSHFQNTPMARFLVLCVALEVLAPSPGVDPAAHAMIEEFQGLVREKSASLAAGSSEQEAISDLETRLGYLARISHRQRITRFVRETLHSAGNSDADRLADEAKRLYDLRGQVVHSGATDVQKETDLLDEIIRTVLKAAMFDE